MPNTPNYSFDYETPGSTPGVTLTGGPGGGSPILAPQVDSALAAVETKVDNNAVNIAANTSDVASNAASLLDIFATLSPSNYDYVENTEDAVNTGSTWIDLSTVGPQVTVETGTAAIVILCVSATTNTDSVSSQAGVDISGASTLTPSNESRIVWDGHPSANWNTLTSLFVPTITAGTNIFTVKYRSGAAHTSSFRERRMLVLPLFP